MKTFTIDRERLDNLLSTFWDEESERDLIIAFRPSKHLITLIENDKVIASINVVEVVDEYDIKADLF